MIDHLAVSGRFMSLPAPKLVIFLIAVSAAFGAVAKPASQDELAVLLPAVSNDSQSAIEIRAYFKSREFAEVARLSNDLIQSHPGSWEGYFWRGAAAIQQRAFYVAVRNLRAAEKLRPPHNAVAKSLAIAYYLLDQRQLFELKMKEAIALDPGDFSPHYYLGRYYLSSADFEVSVAAQSFAKALEKKPDDAASTCFYGSTIEAMGEFDQARQHFLRAVELAGGQSLITGLAYQGLSRLALAGDALAALDFARKAIAADPKSAEAQIQLAKSAAAAGDRNQQLAALHAAAALARNEARPQYQLVLLYRQLGDEAAARSAVAGYQRSVSCFGNEAPGTK
jgi:tetratricopeptide (TPR) repeat protein